MRILVVDDRQIDRRIAVRAAEAFGEVREASSLEAARAVLTSGWRPAVVLTDLHLAGRDPIEHMRELLEAIDGQRTMVIGVTGDLGDVDLVRQFRGAFPSVRLIAKDARVIGDMLGGIRLDEADEARSTMDQGTAASHDQIQAVVEEVLEGRLKSLGVSWYEIRVWVDRLRELGKIGFGWKQAFQMAEDRMACLSARQKIGWAVGLTVLGLTVTTVIGIVAPAVYRALLTAGGVP